ncbi:MAG TPA: AcvB/VirJ family lysyl-phosphatidylglycerol hydrolase [Candidatus Bathyarchaeia archaeon]|nr:AcvB/VirJ family lysyl-phosphatidylglycerol hydrolase [Candidatus Bathyarchaeia archaeon]
MNASRWLALAALVLWAMPAAGQVAAPNVSDLPLVEVPATAGTGDILAVLLTGDGGWAVPDRGLSRELAASGIPVVGLNTLKYFWTAKTQEQAAADLDRIMRHYLEAWHKTKAVLIGYSLGADVLPFMMNRLPGDLQARVGTVVLMGPSDSAEFEFHLGDWLGRGPGKNAVPTIPEIEKIRPEAVLLCVYGEGDKDQICGRLDPKRVRSVMIPGGHKVGGGYEPVAAAILDSLKKR